MVGHVIDNSWTGFERERVRQTQIIVRKRTMKSTTKVILGTMTFGAQTNRVDAVKMLKLFAEKYGANAEVRR